LTLTPSKD